MKKFYLMLFSIALLVACSKDDDGGEDKILGKWFIAEANNVPDFELTDCNRKSFITFNSDNTTYSEYYVGSNEPCTLESETNSEWNVEGEIYNFTLPVNLDGLEDVYGTIDFNSELTKFTFTPTLLTTTSIVFEKR